MDRVRGAVGSVITLEKGGEFSFHRRLSVMKGVAKRFPSLREGPPWSTTKR